MIFVLEIIGTIAFAISGAMVGIEKKMDIFGVLVLGMTTAVGGGIIRDLLIGVVPPMAFQEPVFALTAIAVSIVVFLPFVRNRINKISKTILLMDSIGLGIFTVIGLRAGAPFENAFLSIFLALVTGVGGGVLRDVFAQDRPMIFVKHFYASAAIIGAVVSLLLWNINVETSMIVGAATVIVLRILAAKFRWHLPKA
ncbi:MAG: trimeric intracellular cation channel family protein [Lachnospiraceae bacterium]|nr:trimeric intracellular cation channel family protein [Lachnospiraceae bacterium]